MKNFAKKAAALALCILCVLSVSPSTFAIETEADVEKGKELWSAFVATAESANAGESESQISTLLDIATYREPAVRIKEFVEVTNLSEEEISAMTPYERWLWDCSFVWPCARATSGDYNFYCSSLDNWFNHAVDTPRTPIERFGTAEMLAAYDALMEWQYYFFIETGTCYNFITGKTNLEEKYGEEATVNPTPAEPTAPPESDPVVEQGRRCEAARF